MISATTNRRIPLYSSLTDEDIVFSYDIVSTITKTKNKEWMLNVPFHNSCPSPLTPDLRSYVMDTLSKNEALRLKSSMYKYELADGCINRFNFEAYLDSCVFKFVKLPFSFKRFLTYCTYWSIFGTQALEMGIGDAPELVAKAIQLCLVIYKGKGVYDKHFWFNIIEEDKCEVK